MRTAPWAERPIVSGPPCVAELRGWPFPSLCRPCSRSFSWPSRSSSTTNSSTGWRIGRPRVAVRPARRALRGWCPRSCGSNVMQYLDGEGISVGELHARSRTRADSLTGLERWKYAGRGRPAGRTCGPPPPAERPQARLAPAGGRRGGSMGPALWPGDHRGSSSGAPGGACAVRGRVAAVPPDRLPDAERQGREVAAGSSRPRSDARSDQPGPGIPYDLSVLLAQVLLRFALDYEADAKVSLTIAANTLRVLDETGVPVRDLPRLTGVSKEAHSMALGFLARRECLVLEAGSLASPRQAGAADAEGEAVAGQVSPPAGRDRRRTGRTGSVPTTSTVYAVGPACRGEGSPCRSRCSRRD